MKQTRVMERIRQAMRPGVISLSGFLGRDHRPLADIMEADDREVARLDLTHADIARRMREFREAGGRGLGQTIRVEPYFEVTVDSVRGKLPCPFGDPGVHPKTNITVKNLNSRREITYTDLNIHMIEAHGFYEGEGSLFRLNPREMAEILGLTSG